MENASKALLMAAGVLIGILILSLAVYLFVSFGSTSAEIHQQNEDNQIAQFNSQFTSYQGNSEITIYDVITVANLAKDNNQYYELTNFDNGNSYYIAVELNGRRIENNSKTDNQELITDDIKNLNISDEQDKKDLPLYDCSVQISSTTQRVYLVSFSEK